MSIQPFGDNSPSIYCFLDTFLIGNRGDGRQKGILDLILGNNGNQILIHLSFIGKLLLNSSVQLLSFELWYRMHDSFQIVSTLRDKQLKAEFRYEKQETCSLIQNTVLLEAASCGHPQYSNRKQSFCMLACPPLSFLSSLLPSTTLWTKSTASLRASCLGSLKIECDHL